MKGKLFSEKRVAIFVFLHANKNLGPRELGGKFHRKNGARLLFEHIQSPKVDDLWAVL